MVMSDGLLEMSYCVHKHLSIVPEAEDNRHEKHEVKTSSVHAIIAVIHRSLYDFLVYKLPS